MNNDKDHNNSSSSNINNNKQPQQPQPQPLTRAHCVPRGVPESNPPSLSQKRSGERSTVDPLEESGYTTDQAGTPTRDSQSSWTREVRLGLAVGRYMQVQHFSTVDGGKARFGCGILNTSSAVLYIGWRYG